MTLVTRRSVLAASGLGGAAVAVGARTPSAVQHKVHLEGTLRSAHLHGARVGWGLSIPTHGAKALVVCLHGKGGDHTFTFDGMQLPLIAAHAGLPLAVAAVDGGEDSYWHRRADGTDALAMLLHDFLPLLRARLGRTLPTAVMGWSMGGYGALLAAERSPRTFRAVAPTSPALWTSAGASAPGAFDGAADFAANDVFAGLGRIKALPVAVGCGTGDPFYPVTQRLVSRLQSPHQAFYGPGQHDYRYWRSVAPRQLAAIAPALGLR